MRIVYVLLLNVWMISVGQAQVGFENQTTTYLGSNEFFSCLTIGVDDLNGDLRDDIYILDSAIYLTSMIQSFSDDTYLLKRHRSVSEAGDWSIMSGDLDNNGSIEILSSGNENGTEVLADGGDGYEVWYNTTNTFSQNSNLVDFNNDGFLDFFVCNDVGENKTYINDGTGQLEREFFIDFTASPEDDLSGNYSSIFTDIDNDNDLDLYIGKCKAGVTDPTDVRRINTLYINNGNMEYEEAGAAFNLNSGAQTWSVDAGDIDNDGDQDILIANHDVNHQLMINNGDGTFSEFEGLPDGIESFALQCYFVDLDNNGWLDIMITEPDKSYILYNDNMSFTVADLTVNGNQVVNTVFGDFNDDGFLDLYSNFFLSYQIPGFRKDVILINEGNDNNYFRVSLEGMESNRDGVGAKVILYAGESVLYREIHAGKSFGTRNSDIAHFGLGDLPTVDSIRLVWPSGISRTFREDLEINNHYFIMENGCISQRYRLEDIPLCDGEASVELPFGYDSLMVNGIMVYDDLILDSLGAYSIIAYENNCKYYTRTFEVYTPQYINEQFLVDISELSACKGDEVALEMAFDFQNVMWSTGDLGAQTTVAETGQYAATVIADCNVVLVDEVFVIFEQPQELSVSSDSIMQGEQGLLISNDSIAWYRDTMGIEFIGSGMQVFTSELDTTTVFYYESIKEGYSFEGKMLPIIPLNNAGDTIYEKNDTIIVTISKRCKINSFKVRTQVEGFRKLIIESKASGEVISIDYELETGVNKIDVNQSFDEGEYYIYFDPNQNVLTTGDITPALSTSTSYLPYNRGVEGYLSSVSKQYPEVTPYLFDWDIDYGYYSCSKLFPHTIVVKDPVSTQSPASDGLTIYPNPSNGYIHVVSTYPIERYCIKSLAGRVISCNETQGKRIAIDIDIPSGIYILEIETNKQVIRQKHIRI